VHEAGYEPLQQLALAEDNRRLVQRSFRQVAGAVDRFAREREANQEEGAPRKQPARDREQRRESKRARERVYAPRAFRSSAEIAGTISCKSPITA
jgi:hypothetical protein